jgi:Domain of unknown function (DUF4157)
MSQLQRERPSHEESTSTTTHENQPPVQRRAAAAAGDSGALEAPAVAGDGGAAGADAEAISAWAPDAGLMSAMGLGGDAEPAAAESETADPQRESGKKKRGKGPRQDAAAKAKVQHAGFAGGAGRDAVHSAASAGIQGAGGQLPHLDSIQASFGRHDVTAVSAHTDSAASAANQSMGAEAYATGTHVAFASGSPSLHTAAHEAAHIVQQQAGVQLKGGVGEVGDRYERHADAVADLVVQGKSAEPVLDQMAPGTGNSGGAIQAKVVQFDIKSDLRTAMDGWGTDEEAMFRRCERATVAEAAAVLADPALMQQIRGELDRGDMTRVLDGLRAPLPDKLRLAMRGWGTDEDYIHRSLQQATPAELAAIANDDTLVRQLESELGGEDLKQVLDRLNVGLARKLRFAARGWGTDETYLFRAVETATLADVVAAAGDAGLMTVIDGELSGAELNRWRGTMARRLYVEAAKPVPAFRLCMGSTADRADRLRWVGANTVVLALLDAIIVAGNPADMVIQAFQSYWSVETTVVEGATAWNPTTVIAIHRQMKLLPSQDTRAGVWNELQLTGGASLINRAAWNGSALIVGANIDPTTAGTMTMGYGSLLTAPAAVGDVTLTVKEGPRFAVNDVIAVDRSTAASKDTGKITAIAGNVLTVDTAMTHAHSINAQVTPDDDSALHEVPYLDATVRHEIAHAVETTLGGVKGFTEGLGGWWTGTDIDTWASGIANAWTPNDASTIAPADLQKIKDVITDAVTHQKGSLLVLASGLAADHPLVVNLPKNVPAIMAAEACLALGETFWQSAGSIYASNGKRFSVSRWYKCFMSHKEEVVGQRLADYQLFAPAEFFAEAYTVFYEEADKIGTPGFSDADLGRHVRNAPQREWIRSNVHNRGQAPAAPAAPAGSPSPSSAAPVGVATASGAGYGRRAGNPG